MKTVLLAAVLFSSVAYGGRYNVRPSTSPDRVRSPLQVDSFTTRPTVIDWTGPAFEEPVWVDLLTGRVYAFPKEDMLVHSAGVTFVNVPVYDSPCVLTERAALKLQ